LKKAVRRIGLRRKKQEPVSVAYLLNVETMIPPGHPIRVITRLLAKVLTALYSIRSERQFC